MGRRATSAVIGTIALLFAMALVTGAGHPASMPPLPRLGPAQTVDQNDVGDPFVADVGGNEYVRVGTTDWQSNVQTAVSTDLVHWTAVADALPKLPTWAAPSISMTWGPAMLNTRAGWVLYFSTEEQSTGLECIGRAISSSPTGPFLDTSTAPMLCQRSMGGSIDPTTVRGPGGSLYLLWKNDGNAANTPDAIWAQQLSSDGLAVRDTPHRLIGVDQPWELGIVEAPAMVRATHGGYWLFYSGGHWDSNQYATGLAVLQLSYRAVSPDFDPSLPDHHVDSAVAGRA